MNILEFLWPKQIYKVNDGKDVLSITEYGNERVFKLNDMTCSKISKNSIFTHSYWDCFIPCAYVFKNPKILLIGLGGGTTAYQINRLLGSTATLHMVESSRKVAELANRFVPGGIKGEVFIADGAEYVRKTHNRYDLIVLDAYYDKKIPKQFMEQEFIRNAHKILSESGIMAVNFAMTFMGSFVYGAYAQALKSSFILYKTSITPVDGNVIFVCSKRLVKEQILKRIRENMRVNDKNRFLLKNYEKLQMA